MATLVCVPITVDEPASALALAHRARQAGADLVELRVDEFFSGAGARHGLADANPEIEAIAGLAHDCPLPCIVTCRTASEGGAYDGEEPPRIALFERLGTPLAGQRSPAYIDVEHAAYARSHNLRQKVNLAVDHPGQVRPAEMALILSMHDFSGRPADLLRRVSAMAAEPACRVAKVAFRARSLLDCIELLELARDRAKPTIALGIGEFGLLSRVLAPKVGGFLTFAALDAPNATAPGQPTISDLLGLYRFRAINRATRVFGVVGWPVSHSLSPRIHNAGFEVLGHDAVYVPMPIAGETPEGAWLSLKATLPELIASPTLSLGGVSVTIPHKENLLRLAGEHGWRVDPETAAIGAANTLVVDRDDQDKPACVRVMNTDAPGLADAVAGKIRDVSGLTCVVVGAGGMARAAAHAMASRGARVVVASRTRDRAEMLSAHLRAHVPGSDIRAMDLREAPLAECKLLINATPVGMSSGPDPRGSPIAPEQVQSLHAEAVVLDTVYAPLETSLLKEASARGRTTIDGLEVFVAQGERQFQAWTGASPPSGLFRRVALDAIQRHTS